MEDIVEFFYWNFNRLFGSPVTYKIIFLLGFSELLKNVSHLLKILWTNHLFQLQRKGGIFWEKNPV